jgi:hypothetical protein
VTETISDTAADYGPDLAPGSRPPAAEKLSGMKTQASTQLEELQIKIRYDDGDPGEPLMAHAPTRAVAEGLALDVVRELAAAPWDYRDYPRDYFSEEGRVAWEKSRDREHAASDEIKQLLGVDLVLTNGQVLRYLAARDYGLRVTFIPDPADPETVENWDGA